jgi:hypothetical protein
VALCAAALACLLPFLGKPLHVDDPLFVWTARWIPAHPLDFYGLPVNWHGFADRMAGANKNPPLAAFYLAAVGSALGFGEVALHAGMLIPALASLLGAYALAARLCSLPGFAALALLASAAWLVSSTTLMVDVTLVAFWCWAIALFIRGVDRRSPARLAGSGILAGLASLTKYFGVALVPLLLGYALARRREAPRAPVFLLIQVSMAAAYGEVPLASVAAYADASRAGTGAGLGQRALVALFFLGGCLLPVLFLAPWLWGRRALLFWGASLLAGLAAALAAGGIPGFGLRGPDGLRWLAAGQAVLFGVCGLQGLLLAAADLRRERSAEAGLLALWLAAVLLFAISFNWTVSARTLLPAAPALAILLARRIEARAGARAGPRARHLPWALLPALLVALAVAWADARHAESARLAAEELSRRYAQGPGRLWFQGAWGFQYYLEAAGGSKVDARGSLLQPGDLLVVPGNNTNLWIPPASAAALLEELSFPAARWLATLHESAGAGLYSDRRGPLPVAFGAAPPETYRVYRLRQPLELRGHLPDGSALPPRPGRESRRRGIPGEDWSLDSRMEPPAPARPGTTAPIRS